MGYLPFVIHIIIVASVIILSTCLLKKHLMQGYQYIQKRYSHFTIGSINLVLLFYLMTAFILIPKSAAHIIIYLVEHKTPDMIQTSYTSVLYSSAFVLSVYILRCFPFEAKIG